MASPFTSDPISSQVDVLLRASATVAASPDLDAALNAACATASEVAEAPHAAVLLLSPDGASARVCAEHPARGMAGRSILVRGVDTLERLVSLRRPARVPDLHADAGLAGARELLEEVGVRSLLAVPIIRDDRMLGWISVHGGAAPREFADGAVQVCEALAAYAALAVEHARLKAESLAYAGELESLRGASLAIASLLEMDDSDRDALLQRIVFEAVRALEARSGGIYRYAPDRRELTLIADYQRPQHRGKKLRLGEGMAGSLVELDVPYLAEPNYRTYAKRARVFDDEDEESAFGAVLEVHLRWHGHVTGVLYIDDHVGREFGPVDAARLRILADQAALVLANAEMRAEARRQSLTAPGEGRLSRATHRILRNPGITTLDDRLNMIAHEAAVMLGAESCQVLLVRRPGILTLEASWGHLEGTFDKGRQFEIRSGERAGLTGHIAHEMKVFRAHGEQLTGHFAVRGLRNEHLPSGQCCALLAIPLLKRDADEGQALLGLLRVENKKSPDGHTSPELGFDAQDEQAGQLFAQVVVTAIENEVLVRQLREQGEADARRKQLLTRMFEIRKEMYAEIETGQLRQEVPHRAMELLGYEAACLYDCDVGLQEMVVVGVAGLSPSARGDREAFEYGLAGRVAQMEKALLLSTEGGAEPFILAGRAFEVAVGAPLRRAGGAVTSVLVVAGSADLVRFAEIDREILDLFAAQAASLLQNSDMWNWQRRGFVRSTALGRIEEFIRRTRDPDNILAALLTGMTAGYGLGFNRAAAFLFGPDRRSLEGRLGIGYLTEAAARKAWERHHEEGMENVGKYLEHLEEHGHIETPLHTSVRQVRVTDSSALMVLLTAADEGRMVVDTPETLAAFPPEIVDAFAPRLPLILVPLAVGADILGFVIADTAFARTRASLEDLDGAVKLSARAASALAEVPGPWSSTGTEQIAALEGLSAGPPPSVADDGDAMAAVELQIVSAARYVFDARSAVLWTYDAPTRKFSLRQCSGDIEASLRTRLQQQPPQEGQTAFTVLDKGWLPVQDVEAPEYSSFLSSGTRDILRAIGARSFQGVALTLAHEQLGVVYINYAEPRAFEPADEQAAAQFAEHASLALKQAQMLDQVTRARSTARILANVATAGGVDDLPRTLRIIAHETLNALRCDAVTVYEYDAENKVLLNPPMSAGVEDTQPLAEHPTVPSNWFLYRILNEDRMRVVEDAPNDPDFGPSRFRQREGIQSCVAVPMRVRGQQVGLMFVNYHTPHRFTRDERYNIELFADQAAVVIHGAQLYRRLERSVQERQSAIAWGTVGIIDRHWGHKLRRYGPAIEAWVEVGRTELSTAETNGSITPGVAAAWRTLLDRFLARTLEALNRRPINVRPEEGVEPVPVNAFLHKAAEAWRTLVQVREELGTADDDAVRGNREWLQAALDTLADNAVEAMEEAEERVLSVVTRRAGATIEIDLTDTGCGIDPAERERYFTGPLTMRAGGRGMGVGLTIVRGIAETYGGSVGFVDRDPEARGTTVRLSLPAVGLDGEPRPT
jgi:GAF domain-containing protein